MKSVASVYVSQSCFRCGTYHSEAMLRSGEVRSCSPAKDSKKTKLSNSVIQVNQEQFNWTGNVSFWSNSIVQKWERFSCLGIVGNRTFLNRHVSDKHQTSMTLSQHHAEAAETQGRRWVVYAAFSWSHHTDRAACVHNVRRKQFDPHWLFDGQDSQWCWYRTATNKWSQFISKKISWKDKNYNNSTFAWLRKIPNGLYYQKVDFKKRGRLIAHSKSVILMLCCSLIYWHSINMNYIFLPTLTQVTVVQIKNAS